jgi:hypothetical protein
MIVPAHAASVSYQVEQIDIYLRAKKERTRISQFNPATESTITFVDDGTGTYHGNIEISTINPKIYHRMIRKHGTGPYESRIKAETGNYMQWTYLYPNKGKTRLIIGTELNEASLYDLVLHITITPPI